jgi:hypothetical protein
MTVNGHCLERERRQLPQLDPLATAQAPDATRIILLRRRPDILWVRIKGTESIILDYSGARAEAPVRGMEQKKLLRGVARGVRSRIMGSGDSHPRSLWGVIAVCAGVAVTSATGGWIAGRAYVADELEQIRRSKEWRLPENLAELGALSKTVTLQLQERRELLLLRKEAPVLKAELELAKQNVTELRKYEEQLQQRLQNLEGETFEIREGE